MKKEDLQIIVDFIHDQRADLRDFINDPTVHPLDVKLFERYIKACDAFLAEAKELGLKTE